MEDPSMVEKTLPSLVSVHHGAYSLLGTSSYRVLFGIPFGAIGYAALLAPKVAMYTTLACRVHRPELIMNNHSLPHSFTFPLTHNLAAINAADIPILNASDDSKTALDTVFVPLPDSTYTSSSDYSQRGPDSEQKCASDPVVQAAVARLNAGLHKIPHPLSV